MEADPLLLIITVIIVVALVVFIIIRNNRDKDDLVKRLNMTDNIYLLTKDLH